jgi:antitoxin ParD1/3/4
MPMTTLTLSLPDDVKAFVDAQAVREGHASADAYLLALVRDAQKRQAWQELEAKLREGMQGPKVEMTREEWKSMEREALEGFSGEVIRP